jgi:glycosyltransferase involved in cell wall biosynthesis
LTIGWIGDFGGGHKESLVTYFFPAIKDLPFKIKLILLGVGQKSEYSFLTDYFKSFDNVSLEMPQNINWTDEQDIQKRVSLFDIGIATLLDNELHRSKSGFKTKQYMNNGVPVLSSDIPENNKVVVHGYNGFLCRTATDFKQRIIEINEMNPDSYTILSGNARQSITNFNLDKYCKDIQTHYRKNGT